ncbi:hypothetical protein BGZ65_002510 [Modicella reniformis]|uniref:Uncharacterized protein n=1 Tax=Modicella reniformis TaxID=1440133 RepID=A0A9P6J160_9FUNG|nr:hypothetical protein BGZ65_002510 [Modicella reniformis]
MCWDLVLIDDEIFARQERKTAEKEGRIAEAEARETRALIASAPNSGLFSRKASSISQSTSLFSVEEQEAYKEESRSRAVAIARIVQDLSTEVSTKQASFEARLQALEETKLRTLEDKMDTRLRTLEDRVVNIEEIKGMKDSVDRFLNTIPIQVGQNTAQLQSAHSSLVTQLAQRR